MPVLDRLLRLPVTKVCGWLALLFSANLYGVDADDTGPGRKVTLERAQTSVDRLDFSLARINQASGDQGGLVAQYNRTFGNHQVALATPFFDTTFGGGLYLHAGDLIFDYAWAPGQQFSAGPWVPSDVGTGIRLSVPTGSVANGTGSGSVILAPRLGGVIEVGSWAIAPSIEYQYAFEYESNAELVRGVGLESQFIYISQQAFWFNLTPTYIRDFNSNQGALGGRIAVGKLITLHFALSLRYVREPVYGERQAEDGFDYANIWELGIHVPLHYKE